MKMAEIEENTDTRGILQKGALLTKVRRVGRRYQRCYYVDSLITSSAYSGSKKCRSRPGGCQIQINDIVEIFLIRDEGDSPAHKKGKVPSFTVVIGERNQTLQLIAPSVDLRDTWVHGIW